MMLPYALKENEVMAIRFDGTNIYDILDAFKASPFRLDYFRYTRKEDTTDDEGRGSETGDLYVSYTDMDTETEFTLDIETGDWIVGTKAGFTPMTDEVFTSSFMRVP